MRVCVRDRHGKSKPLAQALRDGGHTITQRLEGSDLLLYDFDTYGPNSQPRLEQDEALARHIPLVVYPHGPYPQDVYRQQQPHPATVALLVHGPGSKALQDCYGHRRPVFDIGWYLCPTLPPQPTRVRRVLFAPTHGRELADVRANIDAGATMTAWQEREGFDLTVLNGVAREPRWDEIDQHDLVVACETFAMLALARGKPVVMFGPYPGPIPYPVWLSDQPIRPDEDGQEWRHLFVGREWKPARFVALMERLAA